MGFRGVDNVLLFGSFTEDEVKSFQEKSGKTVLCPPQKPGLQFGSLDASVSLCNSVSSNAAKNPAALRPRSKSDKPVENGTLNDVDKNLCSGVTNNRNTVAKSVPANGKNSNSAPQCVVSLEATQAKLSAKSQPHLNGIPDITNSTAVASVMAQGKLEKKLSLLTVSVGKNGCMESLPNSEVVFNEHKLVLAPQADGTSDKKVTTAIVIIPRGLVNTGNICFLNATLQALLSCSPFVSLLTNLKNKDIPKIGYPTLTAFVEFISHFDVPIESTAKKLEKGVLESARMFSPSMFDSVLKKFTPDLPVGTSARSRQEDAQEFLSFVMDQMHDELLKLNGGLSNAMDGSLPLVSSTEDDGWETVGPKNKSAITRTQTFIPSELSAIFGGQLRSVVKSKGNKASATIQPFLLLHLDIFSDAVHTIEDALHLFAAPENLEGYKASPGKAAAVGARKSVKIQTLSKILVLHLMRFSYGSNGSAKLHKPVQFPLELILSRDLLFSPTAEGRKYELVATITHHGREPSKGHYTADGYHASGHWLRFDDASVTVVPTNSVLHDHAYVLFYKQV